MSGVPVRCDRCGHIALGSSGISISGAKNVTLLGNVVPCPTSGCSGSASTLDGVFDFVNEYPDLIEGPPETTALFNRLMVHLQEAELSRVEAERLKGELEVALASGAPTDEVASLVEKESAGLWRRIRDEFNAAPIATSAQPLGLLLAALSLYVALT